MASTPASWIELQASAFRHNVLALKKKAGSAKLMPIVKANAYGHGLSQVAVLAKKWPIWGLGVAHGSEALQLRKAGYRGRVLVLSAWDSKELLTLAKMGIEVVVNDFTTLNQVISFGRRAGSRLIRIHIKLDSGTSRLGFLPSDLRRVKKLLNDLPRTIIVESLWSHLSSSEDQASHVTEDQLVQFLTMTKALPPTRYRHIACTAALIRFPDTRLSLSRAGIGIYGIWPSPPTRQAAKGVTLKPVLRWYTTVRQVKNLPKGAYIGYSRTARLKRAGRIAILPIGYADGYDRRLSNRGQVWIAGHQYPVIGRVSMNLTMVDISGSRIAVGEPVELIGPHVTADRMATIIGTIPYEVLARLSPAIPRYTV